MTMPPAPDSPNRLVDGAAETREADENRTVNKWVIAGTVMIGTIMAVLDSSIVNVALPEIRGDFGATVEQIAWVVSGYLLATVFVMPLLGLLSARFGRKRFYISSVALFTIASMVCGVAGTLPILIAARIAQAGGGGVLMTLSQAILRETFPSEEQGMAMGWRLQSPDSFSSSFGSLRSIGPLSTSGCSRTDRSRPPPSSEEPLGSGYSGPYSCSRCFFNPFWTIPLWSQGWR